MGYWSVAILFWQLSIDHIVNVLYKRCGLAKTLLGHPSLPFDSLPHPTCTICTYIRSVDHVTTKWLTWKEVDHIPWVWGSVPGAARVGAPLWFSRLVWNYIQLNYCTIVMHLHWLFLAELCLKLSIGMIIISFFLSELRHTYSCPSTFVYDKEMSTGSISVRNLHHRINAILM